MLLDLVVIGIIQGLLDSLLQLVLLVLSFLLNRLITLGATCSKLILESFVLLSALVSKLILYTLVNIAELCHELGSFTIISGILDFSLEALTLINMGTEWIINCTISKLLDLSSNVIVILHCFTSVFTLDLAKLTFMLHLEGFFITTLLLHFIH